MLTIFVSPRNHQTTTADGQVMTVKGMFVSEAGGFVSLFDYQPPKDLNDVRIVLVRKYRKNKILSLPADLKQAFANLVKGVEVHKVPYMIAFWEREEKPWRPQPGSVIFYDTGDTQFHHAAIYLGAGLYISVYGAGGDLEVATHRNMMRDYRAKHACLAEPLKESLL
jgi:hypothetical protein